MLPSTVPNSPNSLSFSRFRNPRSPPISHRERMSPSAATALPEDRIVLGCGTVGVDYLATVAAFPKPDDKIRSTSLKVEGGGNAGNALTSAARLGLKPRLISKVANDAEGRNILAQLEADGVDTSYIVVSKEGNSPFTYIIVDNQTKTRTCIHTPGHPAMVPDELSHHSLFSALDGANIVYFDVRLPETALVVAEEASRRKIPILVDAEKKREGLDNLLNLATYVVCSENFPQKQVLESKTEESNCIDDKEIAVKRDERRDLRMKCVEWTEAPSIPSALVSMLLRLPNLKFVIATLGEKGCIMIERSTTVGSETVETKVESLLDSLKQKIDGQSITPTCISSQLGLRLTADGIGAVNGRLLVGTAEVIPSSELVDTTGAGDAFVGATLYALCAGMSPEEMVPFAAQVAGAGCRALGARSGLPWRTDLCLARFQLK